MANGNGKIPVPARRRVAWLLQGAGPVAAWLGAAALCGVLLWHSSQSYAARGVTHARTALVASPADGVLVELRHEFLQPVSAREILAILDSSEVEAAVDVALSEVDALRAELALEVARLASDEASLEESAQQEDRRLAVDLASAGLEVLDRRMELDTTRIELARQQLERDRLMQLTELGFAEELLLRSAETLVAQLEVSIAGQEQGLVAASVALDEARARAEAGPRELSFGAQEEALMEAYERRADALEAQVALARAALARCVVRSPLDGVVSAVHSASGEAVTLGQILMEVTPPTSTEIAVYLAEDDPRRPEQGERVRVHAATGERLPGTVAVVGPAPMPKPLRLLRQPTLPEAGVPVIVRLDDGRVLPSNSIVEVVFAR